MLRLASDADIKGPIIEGLIQRLPEIELVRVQDAGLRTASDPDILEWSAAEGRILITHDRSSMIDFANDRVRAGMRMPGLFVIDDWPPFGRTIDEILMVDACSAQEEWDSQVVFLPL